MPSTTSIRKMRAHHIRSNRRSRCDYRSARSHCATPPEVVEVPRMLTCDNVQTLLDSHSDLHHLDWVLRQEAEEKHPGCGCVGNYRCWVDHGTGEHCRFEDHPRGLTR